MEWVAAALGFAGAVLGAMAAPLLTARHARLRLLEETYVELCKAADAVVMATHDGTIGEVRKNVLGFDAARARLLIQETDPECLQAVAAFSDRVGKVVSLYGSTPSFVRPPGMQQAIENVRTTSDAMLARAGRRIRSSAFHEG